MTIAWTDNNKITCLVICAGKGTRITPYSKEVPKTMIKISNHPILYYIINYWKKYVKEFIFIVGYKKSHIINYVEQQNIEGSFIEQKHLKGIADAIYLAKDFISTNFITVLGDCICTGTFSYPPKMDQGIGVWETSNRECIKKNYAVIIDNNLVSRVIEKPSLPPNNLCGMGTYFFNHTIFKYITKTPPSKMRNEIEITDVIQTMINEGESITPIIFNGEYINITYPSDLKKAQTIV